nr:MAG TPA: hypothetical protein [Caudoviricetes sp.]
MPRSLNHTTTPPPSLSTSGAVLLFIRTLRHTLAAVGVSG